MEEFKPVNMNLYKKFQKLSKKKMIGKWNEQLGNNNICFGTIFVAQ